MGNRRRRWRLLGALLGSVVVVSGAPADEGDPGSSQTNLVKQANAWQDARPFLSCWTGGRTVLWAKRKGLRVTFERRLKAQRRGARRTARRGPVLQSPGRRGGDELRAVHLPRRGRAACRDAARPRARPADRRPAP